MGSSSSKGEAAAPSAAEAAKQPLTEATPLTGAAEEPPSATSAFYSWLKERAAVIGSLFSLVFIAVLKTQLTAFLFSYSSYPTAYSLYSAIVTSVILGLVMIAFPKHRGSPTLPMLPNMALIVFFTTFDLSFTNIALSEISTALQACIAATNAFWCITFETVLYQKFQHYLIYVFVCSIVLGAVFVSVGTVTTISSSDGDSVFWGITAAVGAVLCSASKYVWGHKALQEFKKEMGPIALLFWIDCLMIPILLVWTLANGECIIFFSPVVMTSVAQFWNITGTGALGGLRALTQFIVLTFVSATSLSSANVFTTIFNILISMTWQTVNVTGWLNAGIVLVIIFALLYTYAKSNKEFLPWWDRTVTDKTCCGKPKEDEPLKPKEEPAAAKV